MLLAVSLHLPEHLGAPRRPAVVGTRDILITCQAPDIRTNLWPKKPRKKMKQNVHFSNTPPAAVPAIECNILYCSRRRFSLPFFMLIGNKFIAWTRRDPLDRSNAQSHAFYVKPMRINYTWRNWPRDGEARGAERRIRRERENHDTVKRRSQRAFHSPSLSRARPALARRSPHKLSQTTFHRTNSFIYSDNYWLTRTLVSIGCEPPE